MTKQQQTRLATLIGHEASLLLPFVLLISTFAAALVSSAVGPRPPPHPSNVNGLSFQVEFPLEKWWRVEGEMGHLLSKADLRGDVNACSCCLHSLRGGAGDPNECLFCLIHCQTQSP